MEEPIFSIMDLLQLGLMILACYACYCKGRITGIEQTVQTLADQGLIDLEEVEDEEGL